MGSNLGDRLHALEYSAKILKNKVGPIKQASSIYETEPWGKSNQPVFLNQVLVLDTEMVPDMIMEVNKQIEKDLQRKRFEKWGSRTIDIDILFYGSEVFDQADLQIPHPALHERNFTLIPLKEIASELVHPTLNKTIEELLKESPDPLGATVFEPVENLDYS
jgi:2-amino-4-hydroxy-6-hydroxymethyldihydropteridine diphosphokinase